MNSLTDLSPSALRKAADLQEKILSLRSELNQLLGSGAPAMETPEAPAAPKKKERLSPQGIANIRAGIAKRKAKNVTNGTEKPKKTMSAATKKLLSAAMKAKWAERRAAGKKR